MARSTRALRGRPGCCIVKFVHLSTVVSFTKRSVSFTIPQEKRVGNRGVVFSGTAGRGRGGERQPAEGRGPSGRSGAGGQRFRRPDGDEGPRRSALRRPRRPRPARCGGRRRGRLPA